MKKKLNAMKTKKAREDTDSPEPKISEVKLIEKYLKISDMVGYIVNYKKDLSKKIYGDDTPD